MSSLASSPAALGLSIALGGLVCSGGCALVYHFDDYTGESSASAASVGAASATAGSGSGGGSGGSTGSGGSAPGLEPAWVLDIGGVGDDFSGHSGVAVASLGPFIYIAGIFDKTITLGSDTLVSSQSGAFVAQVSAAPGAITWAKRVADTNGGVPAIAATPDGGVVIAGTFDLYAYPKGVAIPSNGGSDIFIVKFDNAGNPIWGNTYGDDLNQRIRGISVDPTGAVYITGQLSGSIQLDLMGPCSAIKADNPSGDGFIVKLAADGPCKWVKTWSSPSSQNGETGTAVAAAADSVYVGGSITGSTTFDGDLLTPTIGNEAFIARIDPSGDKVLTAFPIPGAKDVSLALNPAMSDAYFGALSTKTGMGDILVGEASDSIGKTLSFGGQGVDYVRSVASSPFGDLIFTGSTTGALSFGKPAQYHGAEDVFMAVVSPKYMVRASFEAGDGASQLGQSVAADNAGNVYLMGEFKGSFSLGDKMLTAVGGYDIFVAKYDLAALLK